MGHKAKWEYFRAMYERCHKAGREAKQLMLNESTTQSAKRLWKRRSPARDWKSLCDSHFPTAATAAGLRLHFKCLDGVTQGYIFKWLDTGRATCTSLKRFSSALTMPSRSAVLFD